MGSRYGWLGQSAPSFLQWAAEKHFAEDDALLAECVDNFDSECLEDMM